MPSSHCQWIDEEKVLIKTIPGVHLFALIAVAAVLKSSCSSSVQLAPLRVDSYAHNYVQCALSCCLLLAALLSPGKVLSVSLPKVSSLSFESFSTYLEANANDFELITR